MTVLEAISSFEDSIRLLLRDPERLDACDEPNVADLYATLARTYLESDGVTAAQADASFEAAERVPNVQFLVNAAKAIATLLERKGWNEDLGERAARYLQLAQSKEARNPKIVAAREFYVRVARGYGIDAGPLLGARAARGDENA